MCHRTTRDLCYCKYEGFGPQSLSIPYKSAMGHSAGLHRQTDCVGCQSAGAESAAVPISTLRTNRVNMFSLLLSRQGLCSKATCGIIMSGIVLAHVTATPAHHHQSEASGPQQHFHDRLWFPTIYQLYLQRQHVAFAKDERSWPTCVQHPSLCIKEPFLGG